MRNTHNKNNNFLTTKEVSERLGIPLSTLYRLSKQGRIRCMHIGNRWYFPQAEVNRYLSCDAAIARYQTRNNEPPERRAYSRINCHIECNYSVALPKGGGVSMGRIKNISGGGLLLSDLKNMADINVDDPIDLKFNLNVEKDKEVTIETKGRVVRKTEDDCGIKFRNMDKEQREPIIQFVG